ncbi:Hypothetical predicted protein [Olea europaea subsp. europaea]|uniref:Uncharacterized protein n=1 Tax=Olea europaea subsp. europaea TaxID=158383 RepID=A0A8S0PLB8_OLEEU|nr:Hypothetical predicted protein [Olea europaea subsp. europaea]
MLFDDYHFPALDDLARDSVAPQFHTERLGTPEQGTFEDETSDEAHEGSGNNGKEEESEADDSGEAEGEDSEDHDSGNSDGDRVQRNYGSFADYAGHHPSLDDLDKDMRIDRHSTHSSMPKRSPHASTHYNERSASRRGHYPSLGDCDEEQDMLPTETEHLQYTADIEPCSDNDPMLMSTGTDEVQGIPSPSGRGSYHNEMVIGTAATFDTCYQDFVYERECEVKTELTVDELPNVA